MNLKNAGSGVDQRYLFHGTDESFIEAICEQNFDWRICGRHGTSYGQGIYGFASTLQHTISLHHIMYNESIKYYFMILN